MSLPRRSILLLSPFLLLAACDERDLTSPRRPDESVPRAGPLSSTGPVPTGMTGAGPAAGPRSTRAPAPASGPRFDLNLPSAAGPDIVWQNTTTGERSIWDMEGTSWGGRYSLLPVVATQWRIAGTGDFDGDGQQDLLWQNSATGEGSIWLMDGPEWGGRYALLPVVPVAWRMAGAGDFNADGKPDIVWQNLSDGQRSIWLMNGTSYEGSHALLPTVAVEWEIAAVADLSSDGRPDLVWQNRNTGQRSVWFMNGTQYTGNSSLLPTESVAWRIAGAADFNVDGHPDLLWENRDAQQRSIRLMQGTQWTGTAALPGDVPSAWQIAGAGWFFGARRVSCAPPTEAFHPYSYTAFWRAPYGFRGATPWLNVVQAAGRSEPSTVEIDYIKLWARIDGVVRPVSENDYTDGVQPGGELRLRSPWFGGSPESMPGQVSNGILTIQPSSRTDRVWHPYLNTPNGRFDISGADSVWIEVRVRISGPALVQAGLDYWQYTTANPTGNRIMEAAASDWYCASSEWRTLRIGRSTEVVGPIGLAGAFVTGSPITGTITLRNFDDDPLRLEGFGIEVRRKAAGNDHCDPSLNPELVSAFPWRLNVLLPSGEAVRQSGSWTPAAAGTYCLIVVEKRSANPYYQRPYLPESFRTIVVN